jgi:hypothetical protein
MRRRPAGPGVAAVRRHPGGQLIVVGCRHRQPHDLYHVGSAPFDQLGELPLEEMAFNHCRGAPCATLNSKASDPGWHWCRHQSTLYAFHAGDLAHPDRYDLLRFDPEARRARHKICLRAVWRRCAYVFGAELRQHAGEVFQLAFPQQCGGFHSIAPDYRPEWRMWPIPYPRDGLSVTLSPV